VTCTKLRQQLLDIAAGEFRGKFREFPKEVELTDEDLAAGALPGTKKIVKGARWVQHNYDLSDVYYRASGNRLDKDTWRLRYGELLDVPIEHWPEGARHYALEDSTAALVAFLNQEVHAQYIPDQFRQARAAWALQLTATWGLRTDAQGVDLLEKGTIEALSEIEGGLKEAGLVRSGKKDGTRDTKAAKLRMLAVCAASGKPVRLTEKGNISLDSDACEASEDPLLEDYAALTSLKTVINKDIPILRAGLVFPVHTSYGLAASGRSTSSKPNVQNPKRLPGFRECWKPRDGHIYAQADFSGLELHTLAQTCLTLFGQSEMAKVLNAKRDPHTEMAASLLNISYEEAVARKKAGDDELDNARQTSKVCFHPDTEVLTSSGWTRIAEITEQSIIAVPRLAPDALKVSLAWERPLRVTSRTALELVHLTNTSIDLRVTPDHNMAGWMQTSHRDGRRSLHEKALKATEINQYRYFPSAGSLTSREAAPLPRRFVRMLAATQADGSYTDSGKIRFGFTKRRKVNRFRWLFAGFYEESVSSQGVVTFVVSGELADHITRRMPEKCLTREMLAWDFVSRMTLVRETRFWDGHTYVNKNSKWTRGQPGWNYCSTIKQNVDVLGAIAATVGYKSSVRLYSKHEKNEAHADGHVLSIKRRSYSRGGNVDVKRESYCGQVHCLTTSSGFVLVRSGGKTVITRQCNFGFPGGLGAESLCYFARKSYNVHLTEERAKELKAAWLDRWPEMKLFFRHIGELVGKDGKGIIRQLFSDRWRGGCSYCAAANSYFQGLGSCAAKRALYLVQHACYAEPGSVLYGSRPVLFVHDEIVMEVFNDWYAHDKAMEMTRLMLQGANEFLPDVPVRAEPQLTVRWSKKAKPVYDEMNRLVPWSPAA